MEGRVKIGLKLTKSADYKIEKYLRIICEVDAVWGEKEDW